MAEEKREERKLMEEACGRLLEWYYRAGRTFPWREDPLPYHVWVSEIMLQQTRIEAALPYYTRFIRELPDEAALAAADDDTVMKLWEGLGYYSRVRNMKKAAVLTVERYGGHLPEEYDSLRALPGIGAYTAGAIGSIAFGKPWPAVDGNVMRVLSCFLRFEGEAGQEKSRRYMEELVEQTMSREDPGAYNQALMEVGETLCVPHGEKHCGECPLAFGCRAYRDGCMYDYPRKAPKKARRVEERTMFVLICDDRLAIRKRPEKGLLAGLYELPSTEGSLGEAEAAGYLERLGFEVHKLVSLDKAKHIFSHVEWHMEGYAAEVGPGERGDVIWASGRELEEVYALPSAFSAYEKVWKELLS